MNKNIAFLFDRDIGFFNELEVSTEQVSAWENEESQIPEDIAAKIAENFKVSVNFVNGETPDRYETPLLELSKSLQEDIKNASPLERAYIKEKKCHPIYDKKVPVSEKKNEGEEEIIAIFRELPSDLKQNMVTYAKALKVMSFNNVKGGKEYL